MNVTTRLLATIVISSLAAMTSAPAAGADPAPARSRLGMNLSGPADWSTEMPFVDVFRLSREWISQRQGAKWGEGPKVALDAQGWPKSLEKDCWVETPVMTAGHGPSGEYVCLYEGDGTLEFNGARRVVSRAPGRIVVDIDAAKDGIFIQLRRSNPANPVRRIRLIMPGFEKTYEKEPFYPPFLDHWRSFNTFRFMDWMETNGSKVSRWEDRPAPDSATWTARGMPVEVMVDLCNRLKVNPWFCMPHLAGDDYVQKFAEKVKATLDPSLVVYIEYSNEVWNNGFEQCRYAQDRAKALGIGPKERPWEGGAMYYAQRSVEIFNIWEKAFGGHQRLVRVIAWQAAGGEYWSDGMVLGYKDTGKHADALAIAPYISFGIPERAGDPKELSAATVAGWSLDQLFDHLGKKSLPECMGWVATQKKVADKYGLRLVAYEAGQHLVGVAGGENNEKMTKLFQAANHDPRMGALYTKYLDGWKAAGGDLMCIFASTSSWSKWGSWGLTEYMTETEADQPKLKAVMEWNRKNLRP
jgi:hypothetical protein